MTKLTDQQFKDLYNNIVDIKCNVSAIQEHLRAMNGTLIRHEGDIEFIKSSFYKWGGAFVVIIAVVQFLVYHFFK